MALDMPPPFPPFPFPQIQPLQGFSITINRNATTDNGALPWEGNVIRLLENGNVGIGSTSASDVQTPTARLVIQTPARTENQRLTAFRIRNSTGVEQFRIRDDGYVLSRELKLAVPSSGDWTWADYVFKKDYKLMSLGEVEEFIEQNGHLPGVPSAEDVKQNGGVEVSRIQAKLLEKIEELTLHLIRMEKELEETKSQLKKQTEGEGR